MESSLTIFKAIVLWVCILSCGCERQFSKDANNNIQVLKLKGQAASNSKFKLRVEAEIAKSDNFEFYYALDSLNERFTNDNKIRKRINKSHGLQNIDFELPDGQRPLKFRIDLGEAPEEREIRIKSIVIHYLDRQLRIPGHLVPFFFDPSSSLQFLKTKSDTWQIRADRSRWDPFLSSAAVLNQKMTLEF